VKKLEEGWNAYRGVLKERFLEMGKLLFKRRQERGSRDREEKEGEYLNNSRSELFILGV